MNKYKIKFYLCGTECDYYTTAKNAYWAMQNIDDVFGPKTITLCQCEGENPLSDTEYYLNTILETISADGWFTADIYNKLALENKAITLDMYRAAAQIISKAYLADN